MKQRQLSREITDYDDEQTIWRYLDWPKFCDLVLSKHIVFCRVDNLRKVDPFEGAPPAPVHGRMVTTAIDVAEIIKADPHELNRETMEEERRHYYINCWHRSEHESAAMWSLYSAHNMGIAVKSTIGRMRKVFEKADGIESYKPGRSHEKIAFLCGCVRYIDYATYETDDILMSEFFFLKRKSYRHEDEFRFLLWQPDEKEITNNISIKISKLDGLFEGIYVHPFAPEWYAGVIQRVLGASEVECVIKPSELLIEPLN